MENMNIKGNYHYADREDQPSSREHPSSGGHKAAALSRHLRQAQFERDDAKYPHGLQKRITDRDPRVSPQSPISPEDSNDKSSHPLGSISELADGQSGQTQSIHKEHQKSEHQRQSKAVPHSTPNIMRMTPLRVQDQSVPYQSGADEGRNHMDRNLVQQDLAAPNEAHHQQIVSANYQSNQINQQRVAVEYGGVQRIAQGKDKDAHQYYLPSRNAQGLTTFGSGSSNQNVPQYKNGLNMRPNTPIATDDIYEPRIQQRTNQIEQEEAKILDMQTLAFRDMNQNLRQDRNLSTAEQDRVLVKDIQWQQAMLASGGYAHADLNSQLASKTRTNQRAQIPQPNISYMNVHNPNVGDPVNQAYLNVQIGKLQQQRASQHPPPYPLAPYGTESQSIEDFDTNQIIYRFAQSNQNPHFQVNSLEQVLSHRHSQEQRQQQKNDSPDPNLTPSVALTIEDQSNSEQKDIEVISKRILVPNLNAPINTINCRSPPSVSSRNRGGRLQCNDTNPQSIQRLTLVPLMSRASDAQQHNTTQEALGSQCQSLSSTQDVLQLNSQIRSMNLHSSQLSVLRGPQTQNYDASPASALVPEMPPNTDLDQALTNGQNSIGQGHSPGNQSNSVYTQIGTLTDQSGASFAITQTNGYLTTMAQSSQHENQSEITLSGAAGLRPQNLFHRDEMFQIYLQRPPPPSPLRNRIINQQNSEASEEQPQPHNIQSDHQSRIPNLVTSSNVSQNREGAYNRMNIQFLQATSPDEVSDLDADQVDAADQNQSSTINNNDYDNFNIRAQSEHHVNIKRNTNLGLEFNLERVRGTNFGTDTILTVKQSQDNQEQPNLDSMKFQQSDEECQSRQTIQIQDQNSRMERSSSKQQEQNPSERSINHANTHLPLQASKPRAEPNTEMSQVYHEVIENQHRSNQQTLRGLEKVVQENASLKRHMYEMDLENKALRDQIAKMQGAMREHQRRCPQMEQSHEFSPYTNWEPTPAEARAGQAGARDGQQREWEAAHPGLEAALQPVSFRLESRTAFDGVEARKTDQ